MVLLITTADRSQECIRAIQKATGEKVSLASNRAAARAELARNQFSVVIVEEWLWESDRQLAETVSSGCGTAVLLLTNLAITGPTRIASELAATLRRRAVEIRKLREEVERQLRADLNEAITGILLSSELALATPALPSRAEAKLRAVYQLANSIRERLQLIA